ncbi:outer dense fiber protein 3 [Plakobranchus ocellatus]|uniref:Outer dense fiber protein 3 n=1 Tax=Plakobranchus ocellatus TaxID=259542 RepID=A0AAV3Y523_9GAST|nr:outer dense fiber protein 3 [Plakobranchus ocellatus]
MPKSKGPAPNTYLLPSTLGTKSHDPTIEQAPGYSFGSRYSYHLAAGPGPYSIPGSVSNRGINTKPGFSLYGRPKISIWANSASQNPGPTFLGSNNATFRCSPSYSFGAPYRENNKSIGPGPNSYNPRRPFGASARGTKIGGRSKDSFAKDLAKAPGPAAYGNPYELVSPRGPAFSIGRRTVRPGNKMDTPAPNAYKPPVLENSMPSSPRFSMGTKHHEDALTVMNGTVERS